MNTSVDVAEDFLIREFTDEAMENAGGMSGAAQAGASLYSSTNASGCTC